VTFALISWELSEMTATYGARPVIVFALMPKMVVQNGNLKRKLEAEA
jgi:hypothetical protein